MFEKLIVEVLNKVLGEFIDNLDAKQLDISLFKGKVKLENMKIKSTIFDALPLPFSLAYGQIGLIDLTIPVWNVFNSPLIIEIKDVFALVKPKHIKEWNEEVEKKAFRQQTQNLLEQYELFSSNAESLKKKDSSNVDKLLAKILDNIQIKVSNVYVRYEDEFSACNIGDGKFVCGILLQEFSAYTTGSNWQDIGLQIGQDITYKVGKIKNFTIFFDYNNKIIDKSLEENKQEEIDVQKLYADKQASLFKQILEKEFLILSQEEQKNKESQQIQTLQGAHNYLLEKFSLEVRLIINKQCQQNQLPQIDLNLILGGQYQDEQNDENKQLSNIKFAVRQPQIIRVLKLIEYIGYFNEFQKGALQRFLKNKISKDIADQYIKIYVDWKTLQSSKKDTKVMQQKKKDLEAIEENYTYSRIVVLRKFSTKIIQQNEEKLKDQQEYEKKVNDVKSKNKSGWFASKETKAQNQKEIEEFEQSLQIMLKQKEEQATSEWQKEIDQLQEDLNKENTIVETDFNKMPEDFIRFKFKIEAPSFVLKFLNEFEQSLCKIEICEQLTYLEVANSFVKLQFSVNSITVQDYWSGAKAFPNLIETREVTEDSNLQSNELQFYKIENKQAIFVKFESGKQVKNSPFKLYLETQKTLFVIGNLIFVKEIQRSLLNAFEGETLDFSYFKDVATEQAFKYMKAGKDIVESLKKGDFQHQALDIKIFLKAPVFIVPQNIYEPERPCVVLDTGLIIVSSYLQNYERFVDYKMINSSNNLYDRYEASLQNLSLNILSNGLLEGTDSYKKGQQNQNQQSILKNFNASFNLFNCLDAFHPQFPTIEMVIQIENIEITSNISMIKQIMQTINSVLDTLDSKEYTLAQHQRQKKVKNNEDIANYQIKMIDNIRKNAELQKVQIQQQKGDIDDEDEFLDALEENIMVHDQAIRGNIQAEEQIEVKQQINIEGQKPSLRVFVELKKVQLNFLDDILVQQNEFLNIQMLHLNVQVDLDRQQNISVNISVYKFIIQDMHKDHNIAQPFRLLLANPQVEDQQFENIELKGTDRGTLIRNSIIQNASYKKQQTNDDEEFKDAYNEQEFQEAEAHQFKDIINELEFKLTIINNNNMNIECDLQDLRLNFALPTVEKVVKVQIDIVDLFEQLDIDRQHQKVKRIQKYETVIQDIHQEFQDQELNLLKKIFMNSSKEEGHGLNEFRASVKLEIEHLVKIQEFEEDLTDIKDIEEQLLKDSKEQDKKVKEEETTLQNKIKEGIKTDTQIIKEKMNIVARLNDFSIQIPLDASDIHTKLFSLSFVSDFSFDRNSQSERLFEVEHNETLKKTLIESNDQLQISLNQLVIQSINPLLNQDNSQGYNMLNPCRIKISIDMQTKGGKFEQISKNNITVNIEPIHLRVGFQQVDFVNLLLLHVQKSILKQYDEQSKRQEQLKLQESKEIQDAKKQREESKKRKQDLIDQKKKEISKKIQLQTQKENYTNVKVICEILTLSLIDDSEQDISRPLIHLSVEQALFYLKQYSAAGKINNQQMFDDEYTLQSQSIIKLNKNQILEEQNEKVYMSMQACSRFLINYYNLRTFAYEPLLEPWSILVKLQQTTINSQKDISVESEHMFNINLTHGMALNLRKIIDRLDKSLKQAKRLDKILGQKELNDVEEEEEKEFQKQQEHIRDTLSKQHFTLQNMTQKQKSVDTISQGFLFKNFTGMPLKIQMHNDNSAYEPFEEQKSQNVVASIKKNVLLLPQRQFDISVDQKQSFFKSYEDLFEIQKDIKLKKESNSQVNEEEPLQVDIKINNTHLVQGITIESIGVFSYVADGLGVQKQNVSKYDDLEQSQISQKSDKKKGGGLFGLGILGNDKEKEKVRSPKKLNEHKVGVICNIKMEGSHKKVQIESQLLLVNNLSIDIKIYAMTSAQKVQTIPNNQKITLDENYYATLDIQGYKCLPKSRVDGPLQYVVSFNAPLALTNYNFSALQVIDVRTNQSLSQMGPKETAYLNYADTINGKYNLSWTFYDQNSHPIQLITENFMVIKRVDTATQEKFIVQNKLKEQKKVDSSMIYIEVKKQYYQNVPEYDGENFEFRDRMCDYTSSLMLMVYPKYMIVNRTGVNFICEQQNFEPFTNKYLNLKEGNNKVKFKVPGYEASSTFDITTIGLSGVLELELENAKDVAQQQQYIPYKIEYGVQISSAPTPYNKTTLIQLVPRYIMVNQLQKPVVIKQKGFQEQVLVTGDQLSFNFEQSRTNKQIMVREMISDEELSIKKGRGLFQDMATDEQFWSAPFSIEDIEDFQISFAGQSLHHKGQEQQDNSKLDSNWYQPTIRNGHMRFVRVIVTTQDDATILIVFTNPIYPEYEIKNKTNEPIQFSQVVVKDSFIGKGVHSLTRSRHEDSIVSKLKILQKHSSVAYTWQDKSQQVKKLFLKVDKGECVINLNKAKKRKIVKGNDKLYLFQVIATGNQKVLEISYVPIDFVDDSIEEEKKGESMLNNIIKKQTGDQFTINIKIKGIGMSIIDEVPKELLFLSLYNINVHLSQWTEIRKDERLSVPENVTKLELRIQHVQLDNMTNINLPVILCPSKPLNKKLKLGDIEIDDTKSRLEQEQEKNIQQIDLQIIDETPFFQFAVSIVEGYGVDTSQNNQEVTANAIKVTRLREFQFALQEFIFKLDTSVINTNVKFIEEIVHIFIDKTQNHQLASIEGFQKATMLTREKQCSMLDARRPILADPSVVQTNKMFMEYIHLGAIKAIITIKFEKQAFEFDISDPKKGFGVFGLVYTFLATAASISNSTLSFKELILVDTFISHQMLIKQLTKNYARQGVLQFYKLLGSSDMIGNPLGLVDKLGTGVFEFFSEPKKGLLQGPEQFIGGIGMGVKGLVTNVVSGGMDSVSKISGSLYSVVKNAAGDTNVELKKPDHVFDGLVQGVAGGAKEIFGGITGIFTKPIEKTKEKGVVGTFQGIGQGLFGAISAPVTATLRLGNSVAQGVSSTATSIGNFGKDQVVSSAQRFRPPRYINIKNVLKPYDEETSLVYQVIADIKKGKYANATIKYFCSLPETKENGELVNKSDQMELNTILVITDQYLLYIRLEQEGQYKGQGTLLFKRKIKKIIKCEVYRGQQQEKKQPSKLIGGSRASQAAIEFYKLLIVYKRGMSEKNIQFFSVDYQKFEKIYDTLSVIPEIEAKDDVSGKKERASSILCC